METPAQALEREHREIDGALAGLTSGPADSPLDVAAVSAAIDELRRHIYLEEELLFPALADGGMVAPIFVMLREHAQIWTTLDELAAALAADRTTGPARHAAHQLAVQLDHHNRKEERVVYPQADATLPEPARSAFLDALTTGALPAGWVPQRLRG